MIFSLRVLCMKTMRLFFLFFVSIVVFSFCSFAFANMVSTTMTWYVPAFRSHSVAYGGSCSATAFFFSEANALQGAGAIDGNAAQILPYNLRSEGSACQAAGTAAMVLTNAGNVVINIDANFASAPDTNTWLKIWMGNGDASTDCGTGGFGGWSKLCALPGAADTTTPVTYTTCRDFNSNNGTIAARLITGLPLNDTNHLCFSGELVGPVITVPANVTYGDHNATFQTSTDVS